jgi:hypothetical protein
MIYHGHIQDGLVRLDEPVTLPEGAAVTIELRSAPIPMEQEHSPQSENRAKLMKFAGIAKELPRDAARNLDHCLYGYDKQ